MKLTTSMKLACSNIVLLLTIPALHPAFAKALPSAVPESAVPSLVADAVKYQLEDFHHTTWGLRYRVHRIDSKDDNVRDLIESRDGNVARTLNRHGKPLTAEEQQADEERLRAITAADMARRHKNSDSTDKFGVELIGALPQAMTFTLTPGQPQLPQFTHPQVALDFSPDPKYHPSTTAETLLTGIAGHLWLDAETHHLLRIELNVTKNLNLMFGILARVYQGGTLTYEQQPVGGGHYGYTHIDINVKLRELMVKVVPYHETLSATDVTYLPTAPTFAEAVTALLADKPQ